MSNSDALVYGLGIVFAWNAWVSLALIKIMIDVAIVKKQISGEML